MNENHVPFYRSRVTRISCMIVGIALAYTFAFGPTLWRDTPSLHWLHTCLPWPVLAVLFAVYAALMAWGHILALFFADALGLVLFGWELIALLATLERTRVTNPFAVAAVFLAVVLHYAAARLALVQMARSRAG